MKFQRNSEIGMTFSHVSEYLGSHIFELLDAPVFDNGSSMYPKLNTDESIERVLNSKDKIEQRIFKFPTSHVKIDEKKAHIMKL